MTHIELGELHSCRRIFKIANFLQYVRKYPSERENSESAHKEVRKYERNSGALARHETFEFLTEFA